jgi:hypothetical protein
MKLIFGKTGKNGIEEMQEYFSHIPGTIRFIDLKSDVLVAQEELYKFVGKAVIDEALDHYHSDQYDAGDADEGDASGSGYADLETDDELVHHVQMAVALMGYREYALNNDATHTKTGRMARMDKDSDEWTEKLIDRDDFALQRKAQRAIDRLITFCDDNKIDAWLDSAIYAETKELLLWNATVFHRFHPIEYSRRLYLLLVPMNRTAQRDYVEPVFGTERWESLMSWMLNPDASGSGAAADAGTMKLLYDKAGYAIAYLAMSKAYRDLPIQMFPESMSRHFWSAGSGNAFISLRDKMVRNLEEEGLRKLKVLQNYIDMLVAAEAEEDITDDDITTVDERMDTGNKFARV